MIVPAGKIATGKLAQALMHGARGIALRGNFDEALAWVRELARRRPSALVSAGRLVARAAQIAEVMQRPAMTTTEARAMLAIKDRRTR